MTNVAVARSRPGKNWTLLDKQVAQARSLLRRMQETIEDIEDARIIERAKTVHGKTRVPEKQIIRFCVSSQGVSAGWRDVFEELNARPALRAQAGDVQPRAEDLVQILLLDAVVLTFTGNAQTEQVAIEREALV